MRGLGTAGLIVASTSTSACGYEEHRSDDADAGVESDADGGAHRELKGLLSAWFDERTREIPIVFLTARAESADKRMGQELGGVGYVVKPFDPVTIGDFVERVIERVERGEREQLTRGISSTPGR